MATPLWPVIHRLSTLLSLRDEVDAAAAMGEISKAAMLRAELETTASTVENALHEWRPEVPSNSVLAMDPRDLPLGQSTERARMQSILNNALAYRHSAFVYLYRTIYKYPRSHALVQTHAHKSFIHCVGTTNNAGPMGALLWPLFVASCEAMDMEDRELAKRAFSAINHRQGMTNIDRAWTVTQEVWRRADEEELVDPYDQGGQQHRRDAGDLWRKVTEEMGVTIVFG